MIVFTSTTRNRGYWDHFYSHHKPFTIFRAELSTEEEFLGSASKLLKLVEFMIKENKEVPVVVATLDSTMFLVSYVAEKLRKRGIEIKGFSMKGTAVSLIKTLSRELIDGLESIRATKIYSNEREVIFKGQSRNGKVILKPLSMTGGVNVHVNDLSEENPSCLNPYFGWKQNWKLKYIQPYFKEHISEKEIKGLVGISEGYISEKECFYIPCVDGYIHSGKIQHLFITDSFTSEKNREKYDFCFCPSLLPENLQKRIIELYHRVCNCLHKKFGVDNQMICMETFLCRNEEGGLDLHILEINPRVSHNNQSTFLAAYSTGDVLEITRKLQKNIPIPEPKLTGKIGVCLYRESLCDAPEFIQEGKYTFLKVFNRTYSHLLFEMDSVSDLSDVKKSPSHTSSSRFMLNRKKSYFL